MIVNTHISKLLKKRKLKVTSKRIDVLTVIADYGKAISFSAIQNALQGIDRVTLYRTINVFIENGVIHQALIDESETFYAVCNNNCTTETHNHQHIHFKCTSCLAVTCVQTDQPFSLTIPGYLIDNFEIEAKGICVNCR